MLLICFCLIGLIKSIKLTSLFTNSTSGEHYAVELDWDDKEDKLTDISKQFKFDTGTGAQNSCSFLLKDKMFVIGGDYGFQFSKLLFLFNE